MPDIVFAFMDCEFGGLDPELHDLTEVGIILTDYRLAELARKYKLMIAIGLCEKDGDQLYDSAILLDADGQILSKHRKINTLTELLDPPYARGAREQRFHSSSCKSTYHTKKRRSSNK